MARRSNLGAQFDAFQQESPLRKMTVDQIGNMRSANTEGRTSVQEWADALPDTDRRASKVRGYIERNGEVPGFLCVSPDHSMLMDGHHRYKEAQDAGIRHVDVLDNPDDPRYKTPN